MKELTFKQFRHDAKYNGVDFKKLLPEKERLSCLAHENDYSDEVLSDILWNEIKGEPRALHAQTKGGIKFVFARAVEGIYDYIYK